MLEADEQMDSIIADFVGDDLRLEIKRAKAALAAARRVKFRIEVKNVVRSGFDETKIGMTRQLGAVFGDMRKVATKSRNAVEQSAEQIFEQ